MLSRIEHGRTLRTTNQALAPSPHNGPNNTPKAYSASDTLVLFGATAKPTGRKPSRFGLMAAGLLSAVIGFVPVASTAKPVSTDTTVERVCKSTDPVLVYDNYPIPDGPALKAIDINGDGVPDIAHGEFVERVVQMNGHTTERLRLGGRVMIAELVENLGSLVSEIEAGTKKISRINLSQEMPLRIDAFKRDLFADDPTFPEVTPNNIHTVKHRILEKIWTDRPDFMLRELHQLLARLEKAGVPVVVAAGNFGPNYVNAFSLFPNVITVGSLDTNGAKLGTSADNSLVTQWRRGVYVTQRVLGGIDVDRNGTLDYSSSQLSSEPEISRILSGQKVETLLKTVSAEDLDYIHRLAQSSYTVPNAALNILPEGLYRTEELAKLPTITPGTAKILLAQGTYVYKQASPTPPQFYFEADADGKLIYNPARDGRPDQAARIAGTSFAAPALCDTGLDQPNNP